MQVEKTNHPIDPQQIEKDSSCCCTKNKVGILVSITVIALSAIAGYMFQANMHVFYVSCGGAGIGGLGFLIFAIRSCRAWCSERNSTQPINQEEDEVDIVVETDPTNGGDGSDKPKTTDSTNGGDGSDKAKATVHSTGQPALQPEIKKPEPTVVIPTSSDLDPTDPKLAERVTSVYPAPTPVDSSALSVKETGTMEKPNPVISVKPVDPSDGKKEKIELSSTQDAGVVRQLFNKVKTIKPFKWNSYKVEGKFYKTETPGISLMDILKAPLKWISDWLLSGGEYQQRTYYHLLTSLIDPIMMTLNMKISKDAPVQDKIHSLLTELDSDNYKGSFRFLVDEKECDSELKANLRLAFLTLIRVANPDEKQQLAVVRYTFFTHLNAAYEEYKKGIPGLRLKPKEELIAVNAEYAFMQNLGFAIFTQADLNSYGDEAVFSIFKEGKNVHKDSPHASAELHKVLEDDRKSISQVDQTKRGGHLFKAVNQVEGHANINFDPFEKNNFSSAYWQSHYEVGGEPHMATCLRFGTPTSESFDNPQVLPVMHLFLDYCVRENLKIASFQHQNPREKGTGKGDESLRLKVMFELAENKAYKGVFVAFGFPMDGDFYMQKGDFEDQKCNHKYADLATFKEEFKKQLFNTDGKSYINLPLKELKGIFPNAEAEIKQIVDDVGNNFFKDVKQLSVEERQIFQMLTYAYLVEYFSLGLKADFFHCQCKDAQDRAVVLMSTIYYLSMIRRGLEKDQAEVRKFRKNVEFACLMIKGAPLHEHRFPLLKKLVEHVSKIEEPQKEAIKKYGVKVNGKECQLKRIFNEGIPNQTFHRLPSEAMTEKEYMDLLGQEAKREQPFEFSLPFFMQDVTEEMKKGKISSVEPKAKTYINGVNHELSKAFHLLAVTEKDPAEIFALSKPGLFAQVGNVLNQRYRFNPGGFAKLNPKAEIKKDDKQAVIFVTNSEETQTYFNYKLENQRVTIQAYQVHKIVKRDVSNWGEAFYFCISKTEVDCETGHARVRVLPLKKDAIRNKDVEALIEEAYKTVDQLKDEFTLTEKPQTRNLEDSFIRDDPFA